MDLFEKCKPTNKRVQDALDAGIYPYFHEITTKQHSEVIIDGRRTIMLGSNNYLGLTSDQSVIDTAKAALDQYGTGCSGSRFLNGTLTLHVELEKRLASFIGKQEALTFSTGFQSNLGIISALCNRNDVVFFDRLNHASLLDAVVLSGAKLERYKHNDMADLEKKLAQSNPPGGKLIVVDGVFSMEGDLADLPNIVKLAKKYDCRVMVDDSHGVGVMGQNGRGTAEHFGLTDQVDLIMGTFSKSFASLGGFVAANSDVICHIKHVSRPFIFSASMPPAAVAATMRALEIIEEHPERIRKVHENAEYMRQGFKQLGIPAGNSVTPIVPLMTYQNERTFLITRALLENGVYVNPVVSPAVPEGEAILRTSYIATHTKEQLDTALKAFDLVFNRLFPLEDGKTHG